ncbi:DUF5362 family protein [Flavobacterium sp. H122]|uniref:DUF5362 family protein n=1 Tax=Flavobacterium sp. H122 TaxID=2529860 RepID=UPI0020C0554D|nr:DUF5362 family protein [Flavobacterium sp. H122]
MENKETYLVLTNSAKEFLKESAKWSKFLAIVGFVGIGLMVVMGLFMGTLFSSLPNTGTLPIPGAFFSLIYLVFAVIYFFPIFYLYKYAEHTRKAIDSNDSEVLQNAFEKLKSHHKFLGVTALVVLSIYALGILLALFGGIMAVAGI